MATKPRPGDGGWCAQERFSEFLRLIEPSITKAHQVGGSTVTSHTGPALAYSSATDRIVPGANGSFGPAGPSVPVPEKSSRLVLARDRDVTAATAGCACQPRKAPLSQAE